MYTLIDFFCGCGGMGSGFKQAGFKIIGAYDIDKWAVQSYRENVGTEVVQMDISQIPGPAKKKANVWTFGFPCQDLSIAGNQLGLIHGKRSGMFFEIMRLLHTTRQQRPDNLPEVIMAENVKGLKPYLPILEAEYAKVGYRMYYTTYNSKYWGVPQSRERYFVVGVRNDLPQTFQFPEEDRSFVPKLATILESNVPEKYYYSEEKAAKVIAEAMKRIKIVPEDSTGCSLRTRSYAGQPQQLEYRDDLISNTVTTVPKDAMVMEKIQEVFTDKDGAAYACNARYFKGVSYADVSKGRNTQVIEPQIEVVGSLGHYQNDQMNRVYGIDGIAPTALVVSGGGRELKILEEVPKFRVRKLTPREYFRLQGFPDSYKFVVSDSQLYKQAGNAVTVNVAQGLAEVIGGYLNANVGVRSIGKLLG